MTTMPGLIINCNVSLPSDACTKLLKALSGLVATLTGKPESFVMTSYRESTMTFGGKDDPCAFAYLTSLGALGPNNNDLTKGISGLLEEHCGVPANRIYVQIVDAEIQGRNFFGWNGTTFA